MFTNVEYPSFTALNHLYFSTRSSNTRIYTTSARFKKKIHCCIRNHWRTSISTSLYYKTRNLPRVTFHVFCSSTEMARPRQETDFYRDGISHPGQDGTNALLFHGLCRKTRTLQCKTSYIQRCTNFSFASSTQSLTGHPYRAWRAWTLCYSEDHWNGSVNWINLAQDRDPWRVFVNTVMNRRVPYNAEKLLTSRDATRLSTALFPAVCTIIQFPVQRMLTHNSFCRTKFST